MSIFEDLKAGHDPLKPETVGSVTLYRNLYQGSEEWLQLRTGLLTASEVSLILTPTLKIADNDKVRQHVYEILAQRMTDYVEPMYEGFDMMRGKEEEVLARALYAEKIEPVRECGFITNVKWGFTLGYSPDGLVGDDGLIEIKSRRQKYQFQTVVENMAVDKCETIPKDYILQIQAGLMISERDWCDFISYSNGLPMAIIRVYPNAAIHEAIEEAAEAFEKKVTEKRQQYQQAMEAYARRLIPTERREYTDLLT